MSSSTSTQIINEFVNKTGIIGFLQINRKKIVSKATVSELENVCNKLVSIEIIPDCLTDSVGALKAEYEKFLQTPPMGKKEPLQAMLLPIAVATAAAKDAALNAASDTAVGLKETAEVEVSAYKADANKASAEKEAARIAQIDIVSADCQQVIEAATKLLQSPSPSSGTTSTYCGGSYTHTRLDSDTIEEFVNKTNIFGVVQKKDKGKIAQGATVTILQTVCKAVISLENVPECMADSVGALKVAYEKFLQTPPRGKKEPLQAMILPVAVAAASVITKM